MHHKRIPSEVFTYRYRSRQGVWQASGWFKRLGSIRLNSYSALLTLNYRGQIQKSYGVVGVWEYIDQLARLDDMDSRMLLYNVSRE